MAMRAEHMSNFAAVHRQWWRLHMSEIFSSGMKNPKQTNKQKDSLLSFGDVHRIL